MIKHRNVGFGHRHWGTYSSNRRTILVSDSCFQFSDPPNQSKFTYKYVYLYTLNCNTVHMYGYEILILYELIGLLGLHLHKLETKLLRYSFAIN